MKAADLPGLPTSAVGIEASIFDDAQRMYLAWGVVMIALIEIPQVCSLKFLTCEHRSV
jgi:hypothetical protein